MRTFKNVVFAFFLTLLPLACFSGMLDKPQLVFKVNSENLVWDHTNIKGAELIKNEDGSYDLKIRLAPEAAKQLTQLSSANMEKTMFLFYGRDKFISKATIRSPLGDELQIAHFPEKEGNDLINSLKNNQAP
jgi:preprotein translocase subunit SecD